MDKGVLRIAHINFVCFFLLHKNITCCCFYLRPTDNQTTFMLWLLQMSACGWLLYQLKNIRQLSLWDQGIVTSQYPFSLSKVESVFLSLIKVLQQLMFIFAKQLFIWCDFQTIRINLIPCLHRRIGRHHYLKPPSGDSVLWGVSWEIYLSHMFLCKVSDTRRRNWWWILVPV